MSITRIFWFSIILILMTWIWVSCTRDIVEVNLEGKSVTVIAPQDNYTTTTLTHTFWWEELDGATGYELQIVSPDFTTVQQLVLDTNVASDRFTFTLQPGQYQWRIRAYNSSSYSNYSYRFLTIDTTSNLSAQTLILLSPAQNFTTNISAITFRWDTLYAADDYRIQIINQSNSQVVTDVTLTADSFNYTLNPGTYTWQVRAQNTTSNTLFSSRNITIDVTAPSVPVLTLPTYGDTIALPDTLFWNRDVTATGDSLVIDSDSTFLLPYAISPVYIPATGSTSSYIQNTGSSGQKYFWKVKSRDAAGNWSAFSVYSKYRVQ